MEGPIGTELEAHAKCLDIHFVFIVVWMEYL